eukprot:g1060.t1
MAQVKQQQQWNLWVRFWSYIADLFVWEAPGRKVAASYWTINAFKCGMLPFCLFLMYYYDNYSFACISYTVAHGSYGLLWYLKHCLVPDPNWNRKLSVLGHIMSVVLVLAPYSSFAWLLISRSTGAPDVSAARCGFALFFYIVGVTFMLLADCQKYVHLKLKRELITNGMFKHIRNPNYLGEMMIYGSFASLVPSNGIYTPAWSCHWWPIAHLTFAWTCMFYVNIYKKEVSMSRYPQWKEYVSRTGLVLPLLSDLPTILFESTHHKDPFKD